MLHVHDNLQRRKVPFEPREAGRVSMYVCGPTVYDTPHVGHARREVVFDVMRRYLAHVGFQVTYVANITDIDDKIIGRAAEEARTEPDVADEFTDVYYREMDRLGIARPDLSPRATEFIEGMITTITELFQHDAAYVIEGLGVYFDTSATEQYGQLVGRTRDELAEGAGQRVEVEEGKRSPLDFALWKTAKPGEPSWPTPWGDGRPGWHTECVAMSLAILGDGFDIHGGGDDLIFPHHENELAQAEASGHRFARYWLHNGMVNVDGEKMSKSLGNFTTLAELLDHHEPRAVRLLMLQTHYRRTMEIGHDALVAAAEGLKRLDSMHRRLAAAGLDVAAAPLDADAVARFDAAMDDDFSTPTAVEVIFGLVRRANQALDVDDDITAGSAGHTALQLADVLGLAAGDSTASAGEVDEIALSIGLRNQARAARDFAEADRIRDEMAERGIILEDTADGTTWHRA